MHIEAMNSASTLYFLAQQLIFPSCRSISISFNLLCYQEGESVEFQIDVDENGRRYAMGVTGPDGAHVQGAPRRDSFQSYGDDNSDRY